MRVAQENFVRIAARVVVSALLAVGFTALGLPAQADTLRSIQVLGFQAGASNLNSTVRFRITNYIKKNPQFTHINCIGFDDTKGTGESQLGKARADAACSHATQVNKNLTIAGSRGHFDETKGGPNLSRVTLILSTKKALVLTTNLNLNAGPKSSASNKSVVGETIMLPTPSRDGFQFQGWFTMKTGGKLIGLGGEKFVPRKNSTLWANWVEGVAPVVGIGGGGGGSAVPSIFEVALRNQSPHENTLESWASNEIYNYVTSFRDLSGEEFGQVYFGEYESRSHSNYESLTNCGYFFQDDVLRWERSSPLGFEVGESWSALLDSKRLSAILFSGDFPSEYMDPYVSSPSIFLLSQWGDKYELPKSSVPRVTGVRPSDSNVEYCWYSETQTYVVDLPGVPPYFENVMRLELWTNTDDFKPNFVEPQYPNSPTGMLKELTFTVSTTTGSFTVGLLRPLVL